MRRFSAVEKELVQYAKTLGFVPTRTNKHLVVRRGGYTKGVPGSLGDAFRGMTIWKLELKRMADAIDAGRNPFAKDYP